MKEIIIVRAFMIVRRRPAGEWGEELEIDICRSCP